MTRCPLAVISSMVAGLIDVDDVGDAVIENPGEELADA